MHRTAVSKWVSDALTHAKMSQAELARKIGERLGGTYDRSRVNKVVLNKRGLTAQEMLTIEEITGHTAPLDAIEKIRRVPLISWVSAGELVDASTQVQATEHQILAFADVGEGEFFALRVEGDSMDRVSPPGSVILVNRSDRTLLQNRFYVFAVRGETTYKRWHASPPRLTPYSTNPQHDSIYLNRRKDAEVVGRVKRTLLDL